MWKVACFVLLLPGLALAQVAGEAPSSKSANPLAGVTFWPKAQPVVRPSSAGTITRIRLWNTPDLGFRVGKAYTSGEFMNRAQAKPGKARSGQCAIPLVQFMIPAGRDFTLQRLVPTPIDESFIEKPAVPSCEG
jgi:hypothetical protein